jgi:hypothetical protein
MTLSAGTFKEFSQKIRKRLDEVKLDPYIWEMCRGEMKSLWRGGKEAAE